MSDAVYVRVSSFTQDTGNQKPDLGRWLTAYGQGEQVWYEDVGTGLSMERPDFERMMDDARAGKIKRVIVWRLDRLGRKPVELLTLLEELRSLGVSFVSVRESIDMDEPVGRLVLGMLAFIAAYEVEVKAERHAAAIARIREQCGGKCPWGGDTRSISKRKAENIVAFALEDIPQEQIAKRCRVCLATVQRTLKKAGFRGKPGRKRKKPDQNASTPCASLLAAISQ